MSDDRIHATYLIETPLDPRAAAEMIAGEQSSGTFVAVPGETDDLRMRHRAVVESIDLLDDSPTPALPGSRVKGKSSDGPFHRARVRVSWPISNVGPNLSTLCAMLQGNLYELSQLSGLRLERIDLPRAFTDHFKGPRFGVAGTREKTGVAAGPMIGTIIKPSVGLTPDQTAELVRTLVDAGIDFIKDDELMANPPHSPFDARVDAVMRVVNEHLQRTGKRVMIAFNLTDDLDAMHRHYDKILSAGGCCCMMSLNWVGQAGVKQLADRGQLVVHGHRNGWGMLSRHPLLGMSFAAYQMIWRLAGVDQLHVNGIANKFCETDDSVVASIEACRAPIPNQRTLLPVVSSGQTGLQAPETYRRVQSTDLLYLAGGGILAHPLGPAAGVMSLRQAWQAAVDGVPLLDFARTHPELRGTLEKFGSAG